jgi:hypothetical protein
MGKYKIKVNIEITECEDEEMQSGYFENNGAFTMTIDEAIASNIDKCESSLLQTVHPSIRKALSEHLENISKKSLGKSGN